MKRAHFTVQDSEKEDLALRQAAGQARARLRDAARRLSDIL